MRVHNFERVEGLIAVAHHTERVRHPECSEVDSAITTHPTPVAGQVVVGEHVHVLDHPLEALTVVIVPGAVTTALLRPEVDHLAGEVSGICKDTAARKTESHVEQLAVFVAEVLVHPHVEELVFVECVESAEGGPEEELVHGQGEAASE